MINDELIRAFGRNWKSILTFTLLGLVAGYFAATFQPGTYTSKAVTTIAATSAAKGVDETYSVTQSIRVVMPAYLAASSSTAVLEAAADSVGLDPDAMNLETTREPDSTVIVWKLIGPSALETENALRAAIDAYSEQIDLTSPATKNGRPLIQNVVNQPPSRAASNAFPLLIGAGVGALAGLVGAVTLALLRMRVDRRVYDRSSIELGLGVTVLAELSPDPVQRRVDWSYAGELLKRERTQGSVLLAAFGREPGDSDVDMLRTAWGGPGEVRPLAITRTGSHAGDIASAAAVIILTARRKDRLSDLVNPVANAQRLCRGPVFAVLDLNPKAAMAADDGEAKRANR